MSPLSRSCSRRSGTRFHSADPPRDYIGGILSRCRAAARRRVRRAAAASPWARAWPRRSAPPWVRPFRASRRSSAASWSPASAGPSSTPHSDRVPRAVPPARARPRDGIKQMGLMVGGVASALVLRRSPRGTDDGGPSSSRGGDARAIRVSWRAIGSLAPARDASAPAAHGAGGPAVVGEPAGAARAVRRGLRVRDAAVVDPRLPAALLDPGARLRHGRRRRAARDRPGRRRRRTRRARRRERPLARQSTHALPDARRAARRGGLHAVRVASSASPIGASLVAFAAGVATFGWVGLFLVACAEIGGSRQAGLLTGVGMRSSSRASSSARRSSARCWRRRTPTRRRGRSSRC